MTHMNSDLGSLDKLRLIASIEAALHRLEGRAVREARRAGLGWREIGAARGTSPNTVRRRYLAAPPLEDPAPAPPLLDWEDFRRRHRSAYVSGMRDAVEGRGRPAWMVQLTDDGRARVEAELARRRRLIAEAAGILEDEIREGDAGLYDDDEDDWFAGGGDLEDEDDV